MKTTGNKRRAMRNMDTKPDSVTLSPSVRANESSSVTARSDEVRTYSDSAKDMDENGKSNSDQEGVMKIIIKRVGNSMEDASLELLVSQEASVLDLKKRITEELADQKNDCVPVERQRLIFSGRLLVDDDSLVADVKMMVDSPNYVHLAPIPDGLGPSNRRNNENAGLSVARRPSLSHGRGTSRELRRSQESPYGLIESLIERRRSEDSRYGSEHVRRVYEHESASRAALLQHFFYSQVSAARQEANLTSDYAVHPMICQEPMLLAAIPAVIPVSQLVLGPLRLDAGIMGIDQGLGDDLGRDIWRRINELLPLCRVMPEQLIRSLTTVGSDSDHLAELHYQTELEQTASVLDQVAQRGAELSSSLRHFIYARRAAAQSSWNRQGTSNQYDTGSYQDPYARF